MKRNFETNTAASHHLRGYVKALKKAGNVILTVLFLSYSGCNKKPDLIDKKEKILFQIGDRSVTTGDFKKRAELSFRPFYCRGNTEKDKRLVLNALIVEKLMALEAGPSCELLQNDVFNAYIRGRKEQLMRDKLFEIEAMSRVELGEEEIDSALQKSGMEYVVEYINLESDQAERVLEEISQSPDSVEYRFDDTAVVYTRTVRYLDNDLESIQRALFSRPLSPGQILEPVKIDSDRYLFLRIKNFIDRPAISESEKNRKRQLVEEQLTINHANKYWDDYVNSLMRGKRIELDRNSFESLLEMFAQRIRFEDNPDLDVVREINEIMLSDFDHNFLALPFFKIDEKTRTIGDFKRMIGSHPIFFRDDHIGNPREYVKAFRTAVIDVIQDHYVTLEAYRRKLDQLDSIRRKTEMWRDAFTARYYQEKYIESLKLRPDFNPEKMSGNKETYLDIHVDSLLKKYRSLIELNVEEFEKIDLDNAGYIGFRPGVPYPSLVPSFPTNTMDDRIDYIENTISSELDSGENRG